MAVQLNHTPPSNYYNSLTQIVSTLKYAIVPSFTLDTGLILYDVLVAYKIWGKLNAQATNCFIYCHSMTGTYDLEKDGLAEVMGPGKALDTDKYFFFAPCNLGSPYGSASPVTTDPETGRIYGPNFPRTTVRDDVKIQKLVLDALGVKGVACVLGGSSGGMNAMEWALCCPKTYVRTLILITTTPQWNAWAMGSSEAQRHCIYLDPAFKNGYYDPTPEGQPAAGLAIARMISMLTYRSNESFDRRFGRKSSERAFMSEFVSTGDLMVPVGESKKPPYQDAKLESKYSVQSYMQYQGQKFVQRMDANCYLHILRKMDDHDVAQGRVSDESTLSREERLKLVFSRVTAGTLVIGVTSDILVPLAEIQLLARVLPNAELVMIDSPEGHDASILDMQMMGGFIEGHLRKRYLASFVQTDMNEHENGI